MSATVAPPRITADEFLKMDLGEGRHELVRGVIVTMSPPEYAHGYVCSNISASLHGFGRRTGHGHVASNDSVVRIDAHTVRGADVCYYSEARWPRSAVGRGRPPLPPDLVVEVYSPGDRPGAMMDKVADYLRVGVLMVWVVHPARRTVTIFRHDDPTPIVLGAQDTIDRLDVLPGFSCRVSEFFD